MQWHFLFLHMEHWYDSVFRFYRGYIDICFRYLGLFAEEVVKYGSFVAIVFVCSIEKKYRGIYFLVSDLVNSLFALFHHFRDCFWCGKIWRQFFVAINFGFPDRRDTIISNLSDFVLTKKNTHSWILLYYFRNVKIHVIVILTCIYCRIIYTIWIFLLQYEKKICKN